MEVDKVIEYYNKGQDVIKIKSLDEHEVYHQILKSDKIPKGHKMLLDHNSISFYEWIFNPKYKVFEVFLIDRMKIKKMLKHNLEIINEGKLSWSFDVFMQPKEILKYLEEQTKWIKILIRLMNMQK